MKADSFDRMYVPYLDIDFMREASNVYRTKDFIVKQVIKVAYSYELHNGLVSIDTYYARTPKRDALYEKIFRAKGKRINGKRMTSIMYTRTYVD